MTRICLINGDIIVTETSEELGRIFNYDYSGRFWVTLHAPDIGEVVINADHIVYIAELN